MKPTLIPYLNFNGNAREAMTFYQSVLGGELNIQSFADAGMAKNLEDGSRTMHATLKNDLISFMASDGMPGKDVVFGDNVHMNVVGSDEALLTGFFNKLLEGGKVDMSLARQFWGDTFGMVTDKFGVHWMVNISSQNN
ncbi:MAG: hypothetical protein COU07_01260 [Candidatus Harrisonbacteria bacterium CG10_big_fil_rev_8_21_14_0_10_40_38]|uniref:PhnB-like domain-containing protein n=1 Tax=Candidatus Harrisonbacteria bacterium CG10_big_fil_rev_8_21_14_0_10_40_38 TaxID=1974583 RepID=A0A2H0USX7_9BACT|nr:MAG: hypothetical protein COU07_01260 [Candidatus Harrisonbacteria bacterium CG10_big_fil_rev_8_21_14_0_10_40_38]